MPKIAKRILDAAAVLAARDANTLAELSSEDLHAFHTQYAERFGDNPVKRFKDRATAEARCVSLAEAISAAHNAPPAARKSPSGGSNSEAIAATWQDPAVRAARAARHAVKVGGETYPSVAKAFAALSLPLAGHGAVRRKLVAEGKAEFEGHKFIRA